MYRFAPDLPPDTPEVWQTCDGFHADQNGVYRTGWVSVSAGTAIAVNSDVVIGKYVYNASGTEEIISVTSGTVTPSVSSQVFGGTTDRTGGTPRPIYHEGIVSYGNIVLISTATSATIASRTIGAGANFADVASTPGCQILLVNPQNIVIGLNTDAGGDGWATSDVGDYTNWTTLEAASGNLRQTPGDITAGVILGNDVIAFKNRGVYRGTYVGGTVKWQWSLIHAEMGSWGPGCAVVAGNLAYFVGDQGAMSFDGSGFQKIDDGIANTLRGFLSNTNGLNGDYVNAKIIYDKPNGNLCFFAQGPVNSGLLSGRVGMGNSKSGFYSYNIFSGMWGRQSRSTDGTSDSFCAIYEGRKPGLQYNSGAWNPLTTITLWNATDNEVVTLDTSVNATDVTTYQPTIGTGKIGRRTGHTKLTRAIPRWTYSNGAGSNLSTATLKTCAAYAYNSILQVKADVTPTNVTLSGNQYWADYQKDAQYHQLDFKVNAEACIDGVDIETVPAPRY